MNPKGEAGQEERAMDRALRLLGARSRSRHEIRSRLMASGCPEDVAGRVEDRLLRVGLLDDAAFAREAVARADAAGRSVRAMRRDLERRGLSELEIEEALAPVGDPEAEEARAAELAERRARSCRGLSVEKAIPRVVRHLCGKGYRPELAWEVTRKAFSVPDSQ